MTNVFPPRWAEKYVGIQYAAALSDKGVDCWELVRKVFAEQANIELPIYGDTSAEEMASIAGLFGQERISGRWHEVKDNFKPLDVVSLRVASDEVHCGVMVSSNHLLHIERATASVIVPLNHRTLQRRIAGVYRHNDLS